MMRDPIVELARARSALWHLDAGTDRDTWVKHAMAAKAAGLDFDTWHEWSATAGNYKSEAECRSVWQSIKDGGIGEGTLFHDARTAGWSDNGEAPTKRPASLHTERKQPEPSKPLLHDPAAIWNNDCKPAPFDQQYIAKKLGLPDEVRVYRGPLRIDKKLCDGALALPVRTLAGELVNIQFVLLNEHVPAGDKNKFFLPGIKVSATPDACLVVGGAVKPDGAVYIVEGIGQAWSAHQATRAPSICCFGSSRMPLVAMALRERYPAARLVLVADAGKESQAAAIAKDVSGSWVEMPPASPSNYDLNDYHQAEGLAAVAALLDRAKEIPQRFQLLTPADLAKRPPAKWRVRGVLPMDGIAAVFGPSGAGKSFLVLDLLAAIASGANWFGCRTKAAPVLYVALEGEAGISQRVQAHQAKHGPVDAGFRFLLQSLDIRNATDRADLVSAVQAAGWNDGVLCLDTLNRAAPGVDENDSKSMGEVITATKAIQAAVGGLVLVVHHTGKDATRGMRGHSSLIAALDAAVEVTRSDDRREWKLSKAKDGEDGEAHPFRLDVVQIGEDEDDGEPVTSCVVVQEESVDDVMRRALPPKSGNQRIIWDALQDVLKASSSYGQAGAPATRPCVRLDDAIDKTRGRLVCDSKRQTERAQAAVSGLVARGLLEHREGWIWLA